VLRQFLGQIVSIGRAEKLTHPLQFPAGIRPNPHILVGHPRQLAVGAGAGVKGKGPFLLALMAL